jgi:mRNA interferase RelE/StbE
MYSIEYTREAQKVLKRLPRDLRELIVRKIGDVAAEPGAVHSNVTRLQGRLEFRLRVHDWRVIYRVVDDRVVLLVIKVGSRGGIY